MAKTDPAVASLIRQSDELKEIIARREQVLEQWKTVNAQRKEIAREWLLVVEETREIVAAAIDTGMTTPDIVEVLGTSQAWVERIRSSALGQHRNAGRLPTTMLTSSDEPQEDAQSASSNSNNTKKGAGRKNTSS